MEKRRVLFICKDNAVRSQMAAAFLNTYFGDRYEAYSAGIEPSGINPYAEKVMKEIGIDLSSCRPKPLEALHKESFDCVITLCELAGAARSSFPEYQKNLHKNFKDYCLPVCCASAKKTGPCFPEAVPKPSLSQETLAGKRLPEEEILKVFRNLRDEIFEWIEKEAVF